MATIKKRLARTWASTLRHQEEDMPDTFTAGDLAIEVATRPGGIEFYEFEPGDQPDYPCTIAAVLQRDASEIPALLRAVDDLEEDHHFVISREPVREHVNDGKIALTKFRVTITPA